MFNTTFNNDLDHVICDMNACSSHLISFLKAKLIIQCKSTMNDINKTVNEYLNDIFFNFN